MFSPEKSNIGDNSGKKLALGPALLSLLVIIGTVGFMTIEDYNFVEAFFMTVITMSTVGFREIHPLSETGMVFTAFLIISSFGIFGYVISSISKYIVDGDFRRYILRKKIKRKLAMLKDHVVICGYGRNGKQAAHDLIEHDEKVLIIEKRENIVEDIPRSNSNLMYVNGDATLDETLIDANLSKAKALITTMPSDSENLMVVLTARVMNPTMTIISRAKEEHSVKKLKRAGATNVIMPDMIGGMRMAKLVAHPDVVEFVETLLLKAKEEVNLEEIFCEQIDKEHINKTIGELNIRSKSGANLIGLKTGDGAYIFNPAPDIKIMSKDKLFALGRPTQIMRLKKVLGMKM